MPPSTRPSTFNATSSPDPHREYSEPELPHIRKVLSQRHEPDRPRLGMPYPPASFEFGRFIPDKLASVGKSRGAPDTNSARLSCVARLTKSLPAWSLQPSWIIVATAPGITPL